MSKVEQLYALKALAAEHLKQGRYNEAAVYFKDILARFEHEVAHINNEGEMERAIRELQLASSKNLSLCWLKLSRFQACIEQCRLVLQVQPNNLKVVYRIGRAYLELRQFDSAEHYLRRAFYLDPQQREVMKALQEIEELRQQAQRNEQQKRSRGSLLGLIKWLWALFWAIILFPFRATYNLCVGSTESVKQD